MGRKVYLVDRSHFSSYLASSWITRKYVSLHQFVTPLYLLSSHFLFLLFPHINHLLPATSHMSNSSCPPPNQVWVQEKFRLVKVSATKTVRSWDSFYLCHSPTWTVHYFKLNSIMCLQMPFDLAKPLSYVQNIKEPYVCLCMVYIGFPFRNITFTDTTEIDSKDSS